MSKQSMRTQFALDLRTERRKSGYTQSDVAHLLSARQSLVSDLEQGKRRPRLEQIIDLSLIYARSFEAFFGELMTERQSALLERIGTLPELDAPTANTFNRSSSVTRLQKRLDEAIRHDA